MRDQNPRVCEPSIVLLVVLLLSAPSLAQEPRDAEQRASFHSARVLAVTDGRSEFPTLSIGGGTVVLEVNVDENGRIEGIVPVRDIEGLTARAERWVRTWTWVPANVNGNKVPAVATVAVTVDPARYPRLGPPLPALKKSLGHPEPHPRFLPPPSDICGLPKLPTYHDSF